MNNIRLEVNGSLYSGWTGCTVNVGLMKLSRDFMVSFTRSQGEKGLRIGIKIGDEVKVYIDNDLIITGFVSNLTMSYSATSVGLNLTGFSKTVDLVDCQVPTGQPLSFKQVPIVQIIKAMAGHYGISVKDEANATMVVNWDIAPTETIKSALNKLLRQYSLMLTDNAYGEVVITKIGSRGKAFDTLETGVNILSASYQLAGNTLFSDYVVIGQGANPDSERPVSDSQSYGRARHNHSRKRFNVTTQSGDANTADLQKRARLLRDFNVGSSETYSCQVVGWRQSNGALWTTNQAVRVVDKFFDVDNYFLVSDVSFSLSESGTYTHLTLKPVGAFTSTDVKSTESAVKLSNRIKKSETSDTNWTSK